MLKLARVKVLIQVPASLQWWRQDMWRESDVRADMSHCDTFSCGTHIQSLLLCYITVFAGSFTDYRCAVCACVCTWHYSESLKIQPHPERFCWFNYAVGAGQIFVCGCAAQPLLSDKSSHWRSKDDWPQVCVFAVGHAFTCRNLQSTSTHTHTLFDTVLCVKLSNQLHISKWSSLMRCSVSVDCINLCRLHSICMYSFVWHVSKCCNTQC